MKSIIKIFYLLFPMLFSIGLLISTVGLQGCDEKPCGGEVSEGVETVEFTPGEIGSPQSEIFVRVHPAYYWEGCLQKHCDPVEIRYILYGKSNLGGEEKRLESYRQLDSLSSRKTVLFNTNANSSYRLVVETDVPSNCIDERGGYTLNTYEYTFETPLIEELQGIVYEPHKVVVNDFGAFSSDVPTEPRNEYLAPLTFEIVSIAPASGAEYISIPDGSTGQLVANDLILAGKGEYIVDVRARDARGTTVLLEDVFTFDVRAAPGEIIAASYGGAMYINPNSPTTVTSVIPNVEGAGSFGGYSFAFSPEQYEETTAILPYLSLNATTGAVTFTNTQAVVSVIDDLHAHLDYPVVTSRIDIDITNTFNTYTAGLYLRTHVSGMAYQSSILTFTSKTQVLSSEAPIILDPDPAGYTFEYEPVYEYITINANTGVITVSGETADAMDEFYGVRSLTIKAIPNADGQPFEADISINFRLE